MIRYQKKYTEFLARARKKLNIEFKEIATMILSIGLEEDVTQDKLNRCHAFLNFIKAIQSPFLLWSNKEVEIGIDYWTKYYGMYNMNLLVSPVNDFTKLSTIVIEGTEVVELPEGGSGLLKKDSSGNIFWQSEVTTVDLGSL